MISIRDKKNRRKISEFKLNTLLEITKAINSNLAAEEFYELFKFILEHQLGIGKGLVYLRQNDNWLEVIRFGVDRHTVVDNVEETFADITTIQVMEMQTKSAEVSFDVVIPVIHQNQKIAYLLLGDLDEDELKTSPIVRHLPFIQTLGNIVAVAVENQRLIEENLRQERIKHELELARSMQEMLFPKSLPSSKAMRIAAYYQPHQQVGGDYYDWIEINEDEVAFCVADVSGKGVSAAILMANFQASMRGQMHYNPSLSELAHSLNRSVWNSAQGEHFITIFLAKYNSRTNELSYVNMAHPAAMILHKGEILELSSGACGLGMFEELPHLSVGSVIPAKNDLLLAFTDGVNELENSKQEPFELERLKTILLDNQSKQVHEVNHAIVLALNAHRGHEPYQDDVALVTCRFF